MKLPVVLIFLVFSTGCATIKDSFSPRMTPVSELKLMNEFVIKGVNLNEISGMAVSNIAADRMWAINDSGDAAKLYAFSQTGTAQAVLTITDAKNIDWEAMASFKLEGKAYLLAADVGDNDGKRKHTTLYVIEEPEFTTGSTLQQISQSVTSTIRLFYKDFPKDVESIAVSTIDKKIFLVSKRTAPPFVYSVNLTLNDSRQKAKKVGYLTKLIKPGFWDLLFASGNMRFGGFPTDIAISRDEKLLAILTYPRAYIIRRENAESWKKTFARKLRFVEFSNLTQAESIAFSIDNRQLFISSEQSPIPLQVFQWKY